MIGDAQLRKSGRAGPVGHLLERRLTVAPIGMAMKRAREVLDRDQVGKVPVPAASISPASSRNSAGISARPSALNKSASVRQATRRRFRSAHTHSDSVLGPAPACGWRCCAPSIP